MGGRGSSTGVSDHGIPYGREYHSLLTVGNRVNHFFCVARDPNLCLQ